MAEFIYSEALRVLVRHASVDLDELLARVCAPGSDPVVYLADFSRHLLLPLCATVPAEPVAGTLAGRTFATGQPTAGPVPGPGDGPVRVWVPVLEQTARVGVLALSLPDPGPGSVRQAELLGVFAGLVVGTMSRVSDVPRVRRQDRNMSLPASMQWDLLPPWAIRLPGAEAAGILEPAYDIGGDAYDYVADDGILHFTVIDGMGHGIGATQLANLAVGTYRHGRRAKAPVAEIHAAVDRALAADYDDMSFATGIIGTLTAATGQLEWTCAGHPPPLLLRGRKVAAELDCATTLPFGLGTGTPSVSSCDLEPGDAVLFYTDGVTDAHPAGGGLFGLDRLTDLLERAAAAAQQPEELLRRLVRSLLDYQGGDLRDDATLLLVRWTGLG